MATSTFEGEPQKCRSIGHDTIGDIRLTKLFLDTSPLVRLSVQPIERRCQLLITRRFGKQISRRLPENKLVVRQVVIEGPNHPIPPGP